MSKFKSANVSFTNPGLGILFLRTFIQNTIFLYIGKDNCKKYFKMGRYIGNYSSLSFVTFRYLNFVVPLYFPV